MVRPARAAEDSSAAPLLGRLLKFPDGNAPSYSDEASTALHLLQEAAEAIKSIEDQAADTMARAENLAAAALDKVRAADARIRDAEAAQRGVEEQLADLKRSLEDMRANFEHQEAELFEAEERAEIAEMRAERAEAAITQILQTIRTKLPEKRKIEARESEYAA